MTSAAVSVSPECQRTPSRRLTTHAFAAMLVNFLIGIAVVTMIGLFLGIVAYSIVINRRITNPIIDLTEKFCGGPGRVIVPKIIP